MEKQKQFGGMVRTGEEAPAAWFTFPVVGAVMLFFFLFMGFALWTSHLWISIIGSISLSAGAVFISILLHNAKVMGHAQLLFWVVLIIIVGFAGIVGNHYIYHHWGSEAPFRTSLEASMKNRSMLLERFNSVFEDFEEIEDCNTDYLQDQYYESKEILSQYQYRLAHLNNPILLIKGLFNKDEIMSFDELSNELSITLDNYNALNMRQCHFKGELTDGFDLVESESEVDTSQLWASVRGIQLLYILFIIIFGGILFLVPYFVSKPAKTILKVRSKN